MRELTGPLVVIQTVGRADIEFDIELAKDERGYRATIHTSGEKVGTRELSDAAGTCEGLASGLVVTVATIVDSSPSPNSST